MNTKPFAWVQNPEVQVKNEPYSSQYKGSDIPLALKIELARSYVQDRLVVDDTKSEQAELPPAGNLQYMTRLAIPRRKNRKFKAEEPQERVIPSAPPANIKTLENLAKPRKQRAKWTPPPRETFEVPPDTENADKWRRKMILPAYRRGYARKFDGRDPLLYIPKSNK